MKVNPLMTLWLISCVVTDSDLTRVNRYPSFENEKKFHRALDLVRLYDKGDNLASYKLNALRVLIAEKKKKNKNSETKPTTDVTDFDACSSSSSLTTTAKNKKGAKTTTEAAENYDDSCSSSLSSSTTAKSKKGTKKTKTPLTTSSQQESVSSDNKSSNGNDNIVNAGGINKWKKIQKFFFGPPNWSFNKSYRADRPTTNEPKSKEETTINDSPYLHPIPNITNDLNKDELYVKEEMIKKNMANGENINSKGKTNDLVIPNNPWDRFKIESNQQAKEIEKIPSPKFHYEETVSKEPISHEDMLQSRGQGNVHDGMSSVGLMDKAEETKNSLQLDQQDAILSRSWFLKPEEITLRHELSGLDTISSTEGTKLFPQDLPSEPGKEQTETRENYTNGVFYNYANIPSNNNSEESLEEINNNNKETSFTNLFKTANTISINDDIDERQLQLKPEEITDNIKEKYEVSMVGEDSELSFKPKATMELESPPNQTSMENADLTFKQNHGITADKWKHIFSFNEPGHKQVRTPYSYIIHHNVTENYVITSRKGNNLNKIIKSNLNNIYNIDYESNMTDTSNMFLKAFSNFLKKGIPEVFPHHTIEKLYKTSLRPMYISDEGNAYDQRAKQYFSVNSETELPTEKTGNIYNNAPINEENYSTLDSSTTLFGNPASDYLMEPKAVLNDEPIQQNLGESTSNTPSSTIIKQYSIDMWPKYTEKTEHNVDYFTDVNTQSSVHSSISGPPLEVLSFSSYQNELITTGAADSSSTETANGFHRSYKFTELPKVAGRYETLLTIPLILGDKDLESKKYLSTTDVTSTIHSEHQTLLNLTLHPRLFDHIWDIQSYLNYSSYKPTSTTLDLLSDDKIAFDNQHEFNADHHFQSTTSKLFFSNTDNTEWAPFKIPALENEFNIVSPSTSKINEVTQWNIKEIRDFTKINDPLIEILKKSQMGMSGKNKIKNFTLVPNYIPFSSGINMRNLLLFNHSSAKPESMKKEDEYVSYHKEFVNDPIWNEIMYQTRLRKEKIGSSISDSSKSEKGSDGMQIYQKIRKPFLKENIRADNLLNFAPFSKGTIANNGREDVAEFFVEPFIRDFKKMELMAPIIDGNKFDNVEAKGSGSNVITIPFLNNDLSIRNKLHFWSNLNGPSRPEIGEIKEMTHKYEKSNAEVNDEFNKNATLLSLVEFQNKNISKEKENKVDLIPFQNNDMMTKQPSETFLNDNKSTLTSKGWNVQNDQNEKLLASEKSFDRQLSLSSPEPAKEIKINNRTNNINSLKNIMNQSFPDITNSRDVNKNEYAAFQMSAIKIIKKKPEMFIPSFYDPFKNIFQQNDNNTGINNEMSQMFIKMQELANKLGMKKILLKRDIKDPQNQYVESKGSLRNTCSVLSTHRTEIIPFEPNLIDNNIKMSPSIFNSDKKGNDIISYIGNDQISDEWKRNMQTMIDKRNEKRNLNFQINVDVQKKNDTKPLKNISDNQIHQSVLNLNDKFMNNDEQFSSNKSKNIFERSVVGNKKMKSRELEFILDRNLPRLPLNKRQFIAYMMTGLKNSGNPLISDDERRLQLSKTNLQTIIDRNVKKDKGVEFTNKRPRKKQWHTNTFP